MMTPAEWAALPEEERRHREMVKLSQYAAQTLGDAAAARVASRHPHEPYVAHGIWYVRIGNAEIPFDNYADACAFITDGVAA